ncbi:GspE/PulE family protein [Opitutus terrae]|uniref:Type II secretion system protein E n=1 Tax=Opitutus terrae (strain DSM 11246 / JCM 15787 / PB90-1) TaxID=452637 RepID=B1ZUM1_OPITP|nr:GspE/PulE family protein [Opitutus terrae]ACB74905.1 type II secretion system protein E [Opitutus terrae PB90-1]
MPALSTDLLPSSLTAQLSESQRQAVAEAPRDKRLTVLAGALNLPEPAALSALASASGLDVASNLEADPASRGLLPARLVHDFQIIPIKFGAESPESRAESPSLDDSGSQLSALDSQHPLHLATSWLPDDVMVDWLRTFTPRRPVWHLAVPERVRQLIIENYGVGSGSLEDGDDGYVAPEVVQQAEEVVDEEAAVVRFVSDVIAQAVEDQATDIHFEPQEGQLRIRYRVDGLLVPVPVPENLLRFQDAIISRLKIMARLNISERRLPQDGRINFRAENTVLDIRVSTIPTIYAESVSLRLLNQKKEAYSMDRLGMSAEEQAQISQVLDYPHGIILVTGPTGSGKSTSLNAFLRKINSTDLRIITIEDPIEYEVPGVNQMQVRPEIGLTFADALRHVLRQDPDVIMVGEIRDKDTAEIAIRASLTGHLVFSTLHTNDAPGAITRLVDMGIEPFLVASAIELVIAQRLVRRLCPVCSRDEPANKIKLRESLSILGCPAEEADTVEALKAPVGCDRCRGTGYRGRIGLFEIFRLNDEMHELVLKRESTRTLDECARRHGMRTLGQSGWEKVKAGYTTLDEVLRVVTVAEK